MRKWSWAISSAAAISIMMSTVSAYAGPKHNSDNSTTPQLVVIQGAVTDINGNDLTVKTLDWKPRNGLSKFPVPGTTYDVDISQAVEETYSGDVVKRPSVSVGEVILVVAKRPSDTGSSGKDAVANPTLDAIIFEQVSGNNGANGSPEVAASYRVLRYVAHRH